MDGKFNVVAKLKSFCGSFSFGKVEKDFPDDIAAFDEAKALLQGADHSLVADRMSRVLQTDVSSSQVAATIMRIANVKNEWKKRWIGSNLPVTSGNLETDFVADRQRHVAFHVVFSIRQEETFAPVFVADASLRHPGSKFARHRSSHSFLTQNLLTMKRDLSGCIKQNRKLKKKPYHFRGNFRDRTGDGFPVAPVVRHFKFNRVADFQVFNIAVKLTKMKEEPGLALAALDEPVRMLSGEKKNQTNLIESFVIYIKKRNSYQQFLDDSCFPAAQVVGGCPLALIVKIAIAKHGRNRLGRRLISKDRVGVEGANVEVAHGRRCRAVSLPVVAVHRERVAGSGSARLGRREEGSAARVGTMERRRERVEPAGGLLSAAAVAAAAAIEAEAEER